MTRTCVSRCGVNLEDAFCVQLFRRLFGSPLLLCELLRFNNILKASCPGRRSAIEFLRRPCNYKWGYERMMRWNIFGQSCYLTIDGTWRRDSLSLLKQPLSKLHLLTTTLKSILPKRVVRLEPYLTSQGQTRDKEVPPTLFTVHTLHRPDASSLVLHQ
jgi:hypothetical protein